MGGGGGETSDRLLCVAVVVVGCERREERVERRKVRKVFGECLVSVIVSVIELHAGATESKEKRAGGRMTSPVFGRGALGD